MLAGAPQLRDSLTEQSRAHFAARLSRSRAVRRRLRGLAAPGARTRLLHQHRLRDRLRGAGVAERHLRRRSLRGAGRGAGRPADLRRRLRHRRGPAARRPARRLAGPPGRPVRLRRAGRGDRVGKASSKGRGARGGLRSGRALAAARDSGRRRCRESRRRSTSRAVAMQSPAIVYIGETRVPATAPAMSAFLGTRRAPRNSTSRSSRKRCRGFFSFTGAFRERLRLRSCCPRMRSRLSGRGRAVESCPTGTR